MIIEDAVLKPDAMKNIIFYLIFSILFAACESDKKPDDNDLYNNPAGAETALIIDDFISFDYDEIHLYDSSSHVLIFNDIHPEFQKLKDVPFQVCSSGETVYSGRFWPAYLSSMPEGAYIMNNPLALQDYALKIDYLSINNRPDPRNDARFITALRNRDLLRSGISVGIRKIETNGSLISFNFTVTNMDKYQLLILDPDQMGANLFHYFTNGLLIRSLSDGTVTHATITPKTPVPINGFQVAWLTNLSPGATKSYTFMYSLNTALNPGDYQVTFVYPGLTRQVDILNLYQNGTRIWLGDATAKATMRVK